MSDPSTRQSNPDPDKNRFEEDLKRHYKLWAIRWTVGFVLVAIAVHKFDMPFWLYYGAAAIAALSLASIYYLAQAFRIRMVDEKDETTNVS